MSGAHRSNPALPTDSVLRIDMVRCAAHGICARVLRERISLDPWGFPVVDPDPIDTDRLLRQARRAARACPQHALLVHEERREIPRDPSAHPAHSAHSAHSHRG